MLSPAEVIAADPNGFARLGKWVVSGLLIVLAIRYLIVRCLRDWLRSSVGTKRTAGLSLHSKPVLTEAEARFLRSLESAVDGEYLIWPQLPLWTFIETRSNDPGATVSFKNKINLKRVDFCLVDRQTLTVQMAIELDDRSHQRPDRQRRDSFVGQVLKQAGVPLVRIPGASVYNSEAIRRQLGMVETKAGNKSAGVSLAR